MEQFVLTQHTTNLAGLAQAAQEGGNEHGAREHLAKLRDLLIAELTAEAPAEPEKPSQDGQA